MDDDVLPSRREAVLDGGHADGAGAGAAGPGLPAPPLPHTHLEGAVGQGLDKLGVDPFGEDGIVLKRGADALQIEAVDVVDEKDAMGIAHGDAGNGVLPAAHRQGAADDGVGLAHDGNVARGQDGPAHVDGDGDDDAVFDAEIERLDPAEGLEGDTGLVGQAAVINELAHTAGSVAAHLALAAVGVEHPHTEVRDLGGQDEDESVAADPEPLVADPAGERLRILSGLKAVDVNVIVADAVHLGKRNAQSGHLDFLLFILAQQSAAGNYKNRNPVNY